MPHIKQEDRLTYKLILDQLKEMKFKTKGELEYVIYCCIGIYMEGRDWRYSNLHDAVYAAVHAAHEFERLHLDKREDGAIKENNGEAYYEDLLEEDNADER